MVSHAVGLPGLSWRGSVSVKHAIVQRWHFPYFGGVSGQTFGAGFDGCFIPLRDCAQAQVQFEWAAGKANGVAIFVGDLIAFVSEGEVTVFAVVAGEREVAQGVQPFLLNALPVRPQLLLPFGGEVFVLRQDVLDGVVLHHHTLFAAMVFQTAQPVAAAAEVVEVAQLDFALKFFVFGKAAV